MSRYLLILAAGFLLVSFPAKAADLAVADRQWIDLLGCDDYAQRTRAVQTLEARGVAALPALREARQHPDAEVRRSVGELLERLETQALSRDVLQPRRFLFNLGETTVTRAVNELARRLGVSIQVTGDSSAFDRRRIKVNLGETTFWEALDFICREGGLREVPTLPPSLRVQREVKQRGEGWTLLVPDDLVQSPQSDRDFTLEAGQQPSHPRTLVGALCIRALPAPQGNPHFVGRTDLLRLNVEVKPEPSLDWQSLLSMRIDRAIDERGQNLEPAGSFSSGSQSPYAEGDELLFLSQGIRLALSSNAGFRQVPLALRRGVLPSQRLRELHGTVSARVRPPTEQLVVIENVLQSRGKSFVGSDGTLLKVSSVLAEDDVYELRLDHTAPPPILDVPVPAFRFLALNQPTSTTLMTPEERAEGFTLLDAKGERLPLATGRYSYSRNGAIKLLALTFVATKTSGPPVRLICSGRRSVVIETPFILRDVPLDASARSQPNK